MVQRQSILASSLNTLRSARAPQVNALLLSLHGPTQRICNIPVYQALHMLRTEPTL